jgi:hypothetical protein
MNMTTCSIPHVRQAPALDGAWDSPLWRAATEIDIAHFHSQSSEHHPRVRARLLWTDDALHVLFDVQDRYVKAACTRYGQQVCKDSCVEVFLQPKPDAGYFNFEVNCGGTMLLWYVTDPAPAPKGLRGAVEVPIERAGAVGIYHDLPTQIPVELSEPVDWRLQLAIPISLLEHYTGRLEPLGGSRWRGNFFKCADHTSHPHWASWNPIGEALNFHAPEFFGELRFGLP